ncbi:MAG: DMT family transporter [Chloroflexota bacterium]
MTNLSYTKQLPSRGFLSNNTTLLGWLLAIGATLSFSVALPVARMAILSGMSPTEILVGRFGLGALLFWLVFFISQFIGRNHADQQAGMQRIDLTGLSKIVLVGLISGVSMVMIFFALARLDASMTAMIISMLPVFTLIILAFMGEPLTRRKLLRLVLALVGLYFLIGPNGNTSGSIDMVGVGLAVFAIFILAIQMVIVQPLTRQYHPQMVTRYVVTTAAILITVYWLVDGLFLNPIEWPTVQWLSTERLIYIGILGIFTVYVARLLLYTAIRFVGSGQMSLMMPLETLMSITWAGLFLGERLSITQWAGGVLIVSSALLAIQRATKGQSEGQPEGQSEGQPEGQSMGQST